MIKGLMWECMCTKTSCEDIPKKKTIKDLWTTATQRHQHTQLLRATTLTRHPSTIPAIVLLTTTYTQPHWKIKWVSSEREFLICLQVEHIWRVCLVHPSTSLCMAYRQNVLVGRYTFPPNNWLFTNHSLWVISYVPQCYNTSDQNHYVRHHNTKLLIELQKLIYSPS